MNTTERLMSRMGEVNSLVCCGLDPDIAKIPQGVAGSEDERVLRFLMEVVEITAKDVCAYKAQKAFFDILPNGKEVLSELIRAIHRKVPGVPVFVDCKVGDTENTMLQYVELVFGYLGADGILVNPYMGDEVLAAFDDCPEKAIIVLVRTSNPGAAIVQDALMADGRPLWQYMLQLTLERWNDDGNKIPVISSMAGLDLSLVRRLIPETTPILYAGVGEQGGTTEEASLLKNNEGIGVFVNSSRALLYPERVPGESWQQAVSRATRELRDGLNLLGGSR